ncbi:nicotinamidase-like amidase [Beggiatoa alba B18LD]|uniref:Nicotinamidase-like amidase n=1 Tax=Beggiatoa alba B18LD TaxID=395493 RepID=I3CGR4_9GAMM|nr:cysteine hydrolase family protein [Beggiatoa alba]EIJ42807.1 nicotinamidase-like amidase [Beggiatoa alba B18LD]
MSTQQVIGQYVTREQTSHKRALLVIDVQNEYFTGQMPVTYPPQAQERVLQAIDIARQAKIPVIVIQHTIDQVAPVFQKGTHGWALHESIAHLPADFYIEKKLPSSFTGTELEHYLRNQQIDTVVISGYMTQMCCDTTARYAFHLGFNVEFLADATATLGFSNQAGTISAEELHKAILIVQASRFSRVLRVDEWAAQFAIAP